MRIPAPLATVIVVLVSLVWAANFVASIVVPGYRSDSALNFVFMTIVGGALALRGGADPATGPGLLQRLAGAVRPPPPDPPEPPASPAPPEEGRP